MDERKHAAQDWQKKYLFKDPEEYGHCVTDENIFEKSGDAKKDKHVNYSIKTKEGGDIIPLNLFW